MGGESNFLPEDIAVGDPNHEDLHNATNDQVNYVTQLVSPGGRLAVGEVGGGYAPPEGGIPATDLADDVQTALLRAETSRFQGPLAFGGLTPVMTRAHIGAGGPVTSSDTQIQTRTRHQNVTRANIVRLVYTNFNFTLGNLTGAKTLTIKAAIEDPYEGVLGVTFNGADSVQLAPGGMVISDPLALDIQPSGGSFPYYWSRTLVTTSGGGWSLGHTGGAGSASMTGDCYEHGTGLTDRTVSTGTFGTAGVSEFWSYGPSAIIGDAPGRNACVFGLGDSIVNGVGDSTGDANGALGYLDRALTAAAIPHILRGTPSEQAINALTFVGSQAHQLTWASSRANIFMSGCTHIYAEHGVNDVQTGLGNKNLAGMKSTLLAYWTQASYRGARVIAPTLTPISDSTDGYTTTGNQTPKTSGQNGVRTAFNDWLRDGAPIDSTTKNAVAIGTSTGVLRAGAVGHPLYAYDEIADAAESARNSGIWKANYTTDGIHPSATGAAALAAAVNLSHLAL